MTTRRRFLQMVAVAGVSSCVSRIAAADRQQSSLKSITPASILIDRCTITRVGHIARRQQSRRRAGSASLSTDPRNPAWRVYVDFYARTARKVTCHTTLKPRESVTVQEIADHGIQLALRELGYSKRAPHSTNV